MPNGKTINQIADELGVTKQAVYKKIRSDEQTANKVKSFCFTHERVKYYTPEGEGLIRELFGEKSSPNGSVNQQEEKFTLGDTSLQDEKPPIKSGVPDKLDTGSVNPSKEKFTHEFTLEDTGLQDENNTAAARPDSKADSFTQELTTLFRFQLMEKDRQIAEKDRQLAEKDRQIAMLMEQSNNLTAALQAAQALAAADKQQLLLQAGQTAEQPPENDEASAPDKKSFFRRIFGK